MTSRMPTRGVPTTVPSELIPRTRAELADARRQRTEEKERKKEEKEEKKRQQKIRQQQAQRKIAAVEDASAREDKAIYSLRPDLDLIKKGLPAPSSQRAAIKSSKKNAIPTDILPRAITPVISSPSSTSAELPHVDELDGAESMDDLPPMSVMASSESEGPADDRMHVDSHSESEDISVAEGSNAAAIQEADDSDDSDAYVDGQSDSDADSEDEKALFEQFLLHRRNTKKGAPKVKVADESVQPELKKEKKHPAPKVSASPDYRTRADLFADLSQQVGNPQWYHGSSHGRTQASRPFNQHG